MEISTVAPAAPVENVICGLCRRQFSKYSCPSCNVQYCSLTCFRSEAHSQCSESFYKKEVETGIRTEASQTAEGRLKMLELLKRFEESAEDLEGDDSEEESDEDGDDLTKRMKSMNLDTTAPEELWSMLTPEKRRQFMKVLNDPKGELGQELLASEELHKERILPWWESGGVMGPNGDSGKQHGKKPTMVAIPEGLLKARVGGPSLVYNVCAVCMAYAYVTRTLSVSPLSALERGSDDYGECKRLWAMCVPFMTEKQSSVVHTSVQSAMLAVWSRIGDGDRELMAVLLQDTAKLMDVRSVVPVGEERAGVMLALADLAGVYDGRVRHKLLFYAAHIASAPAHVVQDAAVECSTALADVSGRTTAAVQQ